MLDYAVAVLLLTSPWISDSQAAAAFSWVPSCRGELRALAVRHEVLDPREVRWVLYHPDRLADDLTFLRRRYRTLAASPPLHDAQAWPCIRTCVLNLEFNRAYRQHLERLLEVECRDTWTLREAIAETDRLYHVWDLIRDAQCDYYMVTVRRLALEQLRQEIGVADYYAGRMPPCVPVWRFAEVK